jgi:hypothetical protein
MARWIGLEALAALALVACNPSAEPSAEVRAELEAPIEKGAGAKSPDPAAKVYPAAPAESKRGPKYRKPPASAGDWLILEAHQREAPKVRYRAIELTGGWPNGGSHTVRPMMERPALPHLYSKKWHTTLGTLTGSIWVRARYLAPVAEVPPSWSLEWRELNTNTAGGLNLGARRPTALLLHGRRLYVGAGDTVGTVDLDAETPSFTPLHRRPELKHKAYDLLTRSGDRLVAVDDMLQPYYADLFELHPELGPKRLAGWTLPGIINGHYTGAVLARPGGAGEGVLYLTADYSILSGHGQNLARFPIKDAALGAPPSATLNQRAGPLGAGHVLEEHVRRGNSPDPERRLAGDEYTPWSGVAWLPDGGAGQVLLAAGERGLLRLPGDFATGAQATTHTFDGPVGDVMVRGDLVLVLLSKESSSAVLAFKADAEKGLALIGRIGLSTHFDRFVK